MGGVTIIPARHGGFVIMQDGAGDGFLRQMLFAGSLDDSLEFIRAHLTAPDATPEVRRAA